MLNSLKLKTLTNNGLRCPKCYNFCLLYKNSNQYSIKCEQGHIKTFSFNELLHIINYSEKNVLLKCNHKIRNYDDVYFCNECEENFCINCSKKHFDEKKHKIEKITDIGKKCREHEEIIKYFCKTCFKHFCEKCKNQHLNHNFIDLIKYRKNITINEIGKLQDRYNKEIFKMNEKLRKIIKEFQKKSDETVKKLKENLKIINMIYETYENAKNNYFNIKNIDFINKNNINGYNIINNLDINKIINIIFGEDKNINTEINNINNINENNNNEVNNINVSNDEIKSTDIPNISNNLDNNININPEEKDSISSNNSNVFTNENSLKNTSMVNNNQNITPIKYNNKNDISHKLLRNLSSNSEDRPTGISSLTKNRNYKNLYNNEFQINSVDNNLSISGTISQIKVPKKPKSPFLKISNSQPITNMIHIVDNILLLTINSANESNMQIYEINYNNEKNAQLKSTLKINIHKKNVVNHIMKSNNSNWIFLSCSKDYLSKFEVNYSKKSYNETFFFSNKLNEIHKFDHSFNLCYFIDNYLLITTGSKSGLTFWKSHKDSYVPYRPTYDNIYFSSVVTIDFDNIISVGTETQSMISSVFSFRVNSKNIVNENYKVNLTKVAGFKKTTLKKIDKNHVIIGLYNDGILIFNFRSKNIVKSVEIGNKISHIIVSEIKHFHSNDCHYYIVEKRKNNILFFVDNIIDRKNEFGEINFTIKKSKEYYLDAKSNIIDFVFIDFNINSKSVNNGKHIILADKYGNIYSN